MLRLPNSLLLILVLAGGAAAQNTVYKTVDEDGVVSFSDQPPTTGQAAETLTIDTPAAQPTGEYSKNLEAMRETTDRMAQDRMAREKHRAEMRELASRQAQQAPTYQDPGYTSYYPSTYSRSYRREYRPPWYWGGHRPRPEHPIARPPMRPQPTPHPGSLQNNAQLMRPIVSDNTSSRGWTR